MMFHLCRAFPTTDPPRLRQLLTVVLSQGTPSFAGCCSQTGWVKHVGGDPAPWAGAMKVQRVVVTWHVGSCRGLCGCSW